MKRLSIEKFYEIIKEDFFKLGFNMGEPFPHNGVISFYKDDKRYVTTFGCDFNSEKEQFYINQSTYSRIILEEVNNVLFQFIENSGNEHYTVSRLPDFKSEEPIVKATYITNKEDLAEAKNILLEYVTNNVLPFFEQIKTVEDVNEKIINVFDWMRWADYIPGQTYYKALIILKLSKSSSYDSFYLMYKDRLEEHLNNGMPELADYLKNFILIWEYLEQNY